MVKKVWLVADDYGLSPGVGRAIRALLDDRRLSGTGCMTLFPEWPYEASLLKAAPGYANAAVGIHLTLTDFAPLTGKSAVAPDGKLPPLGKLIRMAMRPSPELVAAIHAELDAQLDEFTWMERAPHYLDGHQHVHFLPPIRSWLASRRHRFAAAGDGPWLRGAPSLALADGVMMRAKVGVVAMLARGFDQAMRQAGYVVKGPLGGFYDWKDAGGFPAMIGGLAERAPDESIIMCHPGEVDATLIARDGLVQARATEYASIAGGLPFTPA